MSATFNEADRFLIERWVDARELETGMESLQKKYEGLLDQVIDALKKREWWEAANFRTYVKGLRGCLGFGRKSWGGDPDDFVGLWFDDLKLDNLLIETEPLPVAYLWLRPLKRTGADRDAVLGRISKMAEGPLKQLPRRIDDDHNFAFCHRLSETRKEIAGTLLSDGGQSFVEFLLSHFDRLALLIPAVDAVVGKAMRN